MNPETIITDKSSALWLIGIAAIILFFILRLLRKYLPLLPKREKIRRVLKKQIQAIEIIIWALFAFYAIPKFSDNIPLLIIVLCIVLSFVIFYAWFYIKEYVAGITFRGDVDIKIGDTITFNGITGKIKKLSNQHVEIETDNEIFYFPYSQILKGTYSKYCNSEQSHICNFTLSLNPAMYDTDTIFEIRKYLLTFPSVATTMEPDIKCVKNEKGFVSLNISFISLDEERNEIIIQHVKEKFIK
ncbi:MAG: mechanosensitive ion channel [Bacteroidales bacterium]|nr:mechanosensitive ion channel [Bacteroidales bacterium]